jgi:hypothetical protein
LLCGCSDARYTSAASGIRSVFLAGIALSGVAAGFAQTGFLTGGMTEIPAHSHAAGIGTLNASRQAGAAIGTAALITLAGTADTAAGYRSAWACAAGFGAAAFLCACLMSSRRPSRPRLGDIGRIREPGTQRRPDRRCGAGQRDDTGRDGPPAR